MCDLKVPALMLRSLGLSAKLFEAGHGKQFLYGYLCTEGAFSTVPPHHSPNGDHDLGGTMSDGIEQATVRQKC